MPEIAEAGVSSKLGYIYTLSAPGSESVRYVGQAVDPKKRYLLHVCLSKKKRTHKEKWISQILASDQKPVMEIIWVGGVQFIDKKEDEFIRLFKAMGAMLTNATNGGKGSRGRVYTEEMRAKMSASMAGRKQSVPRSAEYRKKVSDRMQGFKHTPESKAKLSIAMTGKPGIWSTREMPEHVKQLSRENGAITSKGIIAIKDGVETYYPSQIQAERETGCGRKEMRLVANGVYKQTNGYKFRHA